MKKPVNLCETDRRKSKDLTQLSSFKRCNKREPIYKCVGKKNFPT